jgi:N-methylhydantoinase A
MLGSPFDAGALTTIVEDLERQALDAMVSGGVDPSRVQLERTAIMRYADQYLQELTVRIPDGAITAETGQELERLFTAEYARLYSEAALALFQTIEVATVRLSARVPITAVTMAPTSRSAAERRPKPEASRVVHWPGGDAAETAVYTEPLAPGDIVDGPAVVELPHTTVAVAPGQRLRADSRGTLTLLLAQGA